MMGLSLERSSLMRYSDGVMELPCSAAVALLLVPALEV